MVLNTRREITMTTATELAEFLGCDEHGMARVRESTDASVNVVEVLAACDFDPAKFVCELELVHPESKLFFAWAEAASTSQGAPLPGGERVARSSESVQS